MKKTPSSPRFYTSFVNSIVFVIAFSILLILLLLKIHNSSRVEQQRNVEDFSKNVARRVEFKLNGNLDYLNLLAKERAEGILKTESFNSKLEDYLLAHPEFINITWVDSLFVIENVAPIKGNSFIIGLLVDLPEPKKASRKAKETKQPVYTKPFEAIQSNSSFEVWVPVFNGDEFLGLLAGVYSCDKLLNSCLDNEDYQNSQICLLNEESNVIALYPKKLKQTNSISYTEDLNLLNLNMKIKFEIINKQSFGWISILLLSSTILFILGFSFSLYKLTEENRLRKQAQVKLEKSETFLKKQNKEYLLLNEQYVSQNVSLKKVKVASEESEKRFRNLFSKSPISLWEEDFSEVRALLNNKIKEVDDLKEYLNENAEFVSLCASRIKILNVNSITLDLLGVSTKDELSAHFSEAFTLKSIETFKDELVAIANNAKEFKSETEFIRGDGKVITVIISMIILEDNERAIISLVDITELKEGELKLLKSKEKAEESDRLKTEFLNNMSHEIRTPMNGILGFSDMLDNPDISVEKRNVFIKIIQSSGNQLLKVIDDILEISILGTKQVKVVDEKICLNELLFELFSVFDIKAKENKNPLYLKKGLSDKESTIFTDKTKLNKILSNLLENALKFTNKGFIEMGYELKNNKLELYVKDTGIGIDSKMHKSIFERFSQGEKDLTKVTGGLGLGLSIAKENTNLLGGSIQLESKKGEGSTFYVTIPYNPVYETNMSKKNLSDELQEYTILIAEDEEVNYLYLETLLLNVLELNCKLIHVINGENAVEECKANTSIDLILMDLKMPIMNGFEATKKIKTLRPHLSIIAQTAYSTNKEKQQANEAGCDDFITKPITKGVMKSILEKYLR